MKINPNIFKKAGVDPETITENEEEWITEAGELTKNELIAISLFWRRIAKFPEMGEIAKQDLYDVYLWVKLRELRGIKHIAKQEIRDWLSNKAGQYPIISTILNAEKVPE